ncbi:helix-turn-helix domain-containing protein [Aquibium oceanicum]|uniref:helix-turn-helix domain-containing protein n=1 Tax=Aquibium oceanicum TaxID=1670800 RepID=UPI0009F84DE4
MCPSHVRAICPHGCRRADRRQFLPPPLSQAQLAEALGTSVVHINRTLQKLRADGLADHKKGRLYILNWDRLSEVADFDPAYLNLRDPPS